MGFYVHVYGPFYSVAKLKYIFRGSVAVILIVFGCSSLVEAHLGENLLLIKLVVAPWAGAYHSNNMEELAGLLAEDFKGSAEASDAYLARIRIFSVENVLLQYATNQKD